MKILGIIVLVVLGILGFFSVLNWLSRRSGPWLTRAEAADMLQSFLDDTDEAYDMDSFLTVPMNDPELDAASREVDHLLTVYPPKTKAWFDHPDAIDAVRRMIEHLRTTPRERSDVTDSPS